MSDISWSLQLIAGELNELSFETCMTRANSIPEEEEQCRTKSLLAPKPLGTQELGASFLETFNKDLINIDTEQLEKIKQLDLPVPF